MEITELQKDLAATFRWTARLNMHEAVANGNKQHMILANHGIITTGETVAEGFNSLYYFEKAAETYITALSTNKNLNIVSHEVAEKTCEEAANYPVDTAKQFLSQIRLILDKEEPEYVN